MGSTAAAGTITMHDDAQDAISGLPTTAAISL